MDGNKFSNLDYVLNKTTAGNIFYDKNQVKNEKIKRHIYAGSQSLISVG